MLVSITSTLRPLGSTTTATRPGEASNVAKFAAAVAAADRAIQVQGGNGLSAEYGLIPQCSLARLLRIAPVSREMILNYVAQHSLALQPRSH